MWSGVPIIVARGPYCLLLLVLVLKLLLVQNASARLLRDGCENVALLIKDLHWVLFCNKIKFKTLILAFKALNNFGPGFLRSVCSL